MDHTMYQGYQKAKFG